MTRTEIKERLKIAHQNLWVECQAMNILDQHKSHEGKWSALQHIQHISKGIAAFCKYLKYEKSMIANTFGTTDRSSRTYEDVFQAYIKRLSEGAVSTPPFNPEESQNISLEVEIKRGEQILDDIISSLDHWDDKALDQYICPHPNLGKMTVREMLYFTIFHADHHHQAIKNLKRL